VHIRGTFQEVGLADLARFIATTRMSGVLKVFADPSGLICFVEGDLDVAYRSHGSHRERLSAYSASSDPLEGRRMERDRLAELMRLDQSGAAFSFESKEVEASGLPPFTLEQLQRPAGHGPAGVDAYRPGQAPPDRPVATHSSPTHSSPTAETRASRHTFSTLLPEQSPSETTERPMAIDAQSAQPAHLSSGQTATGPVAVAARRASMPSTRQQARAQRSRGGALARLIGAVRQRQGDQ
jgi:hypothetical protein